MRSPKIRFKGYSEDWEQRKLGEITELKSASRVHKDEWTSNGVPFYRSSDVMAAINGTENEKAFISEELYEKLSKVSGKLEEGDILVTGGGSVGNPYIVPDNKPLYTKDADLLWIKNKGKFHPYFLYEFFFSPTFRNYLGSISHVGTIAHYTITQLSETPICLPSFEEQKEVGEYFQSLDHLITLHQRKCEQTQKLKKYMLQKMFPQDKTNVPKIRFDGFTDAWEQRKLGEITELKSASRVHKDEWTSNGVPFYRSSDVMAAINGTENEKAFISEELYEKLSKVSGKLEEGDILVTGGGSVGNPYIVPDNKPLYTKDADLLWIKNKGKFHPYFLYEFFFSPTFRNYLGSISHVGTIAHYTITQLSETPICLPSFEEQKEVGNIFKVSTTSSLFTSRSVTSYKV
ncbi:MAG: restriction endonuclease subunit S [Lachnospiraceae bacterium]